MTWLSQGSRMFAVFGVMPLLVTRLADQEVAVWYLFTSAIAFTGLLDTGITPTLQRFIAYGMGGVNRAEDCVRKGRGPVQKGSGVPEWAFVDTVYGSVCVMNRWLTAVTVLLLGVIGTLALVRPVSQTSDPTMTWLSWAFIILSQTILFLSRPYSAVLAGTNHVALEARWASVMNLLGTTAQIVVLLAGGGLVGLAITSVGTAIVAFFRLRFLVFRIEGGRFRSVRAHLDRSVLRVAWEPCWKSAVVCVSSTGMIQLSGFVYAQIGTGSSLAAYLFSVRLLTILQTISTTPFYAKVPYFVRLFASAQFDELARKAGRSAAISLWLFALGVLGIGFLGPVALELIHSNVSLLPASSWFLLGFVWLYERNNGMHGQIITWTNDIYAFWVVPIFGAVYLLLQFFLGARFGSTGLIWAYVISFIPIYCGWVQKKACSVLHQSLRTFTLRYTVAPVALVGAVTAAGQCGLYKLFLR